MIVIIPARGGSQRIPGKNLKIFHGKPIIQYSIDLAEEMEAEVTVSTDDKAIAEYSWKQKATVHNRSAELSADEIGTQEVIKNVLLDREENVETMVCVLYATSPLLKYDDVKRGIDAIHDDKTIFYSYSVGQDGVDAGNFYLGFAGAFMQDMPLEGNSAHVKLPYERTIDINVMADFYRAEKMYEKLYGQEDG